LPGSKARKQHRLPGAVDQVEHPLHVVRHFLRRTCQRVFGIGREHHLDRHAIGKFYRRTDRIGIVGAVERALGRRLQLLLVAAGRLDIGLDGVPGGDIALGHLLRVDDQSVVGLGAEPGAGPVGRAREHGCRRVVLGEHQKLVVRDVADLQDAVDHVDAGLLQVGAVFGIRVLVRRRGIGFGDLLVAQNHIAAFRISLQAFLEPVGVVEFIKRAVDRAALLVGPRQQFGHAVGKLTHQADADRIAGVEDVRGQRLNAGLVIKRMAQRLRRHNTPVEIGAEWRAFFGERDLVAQQRINTLQRRECATRRAAHRHDAILISPTALCKEVLPPEFLDRRLLGGQLKRLVLVFETRQRGQDGFLVVRVDIDLVNGKAEAAVEVAIERPGNYGDIIVGECDGGHRNILRKETR
jgi:hypothetical protein